MKKAELIKALSERAGISNASSKETIDILLEIITEELLNDEGIEIGGFGKLEVKTRAERTGINPSTKERISIPSSKNVSFKAAKALKDKLNK